jgi:hypothetical protein
MDDFTPRNIMKYIATGVISMKAASMTKDALVDHTRFDEDDIVVKIGAGVVGWGAGHHAKPYTDKAVDKVADFVNAKREARKAKKEDTTENEK